MFKDLLTAMSDMFRAVSRKVYKETKGEKRPFESWVRNSRLDQIIGGYLFGGKNSSVPTMQAWPTEKLPYGTEFKEEIIKLKKDLGL